MTELSRLESDLIEDFKAIQQPRPKYVLQQFVVGQHDTPSQQWAQCVLEEQITLFNLKRSLINKRKTERKIKYLESIGRGETVVCDAKDRADAIDDAELARIDLAEIELAELGARRELRDLDEIRRSFGRSYSREDLDNEQESYWHKRLIRQSQHDVNASGRISVGNQDSLRMAGLPVPGQPTFIDSIQRRFLETGRSRILVAIPTLISRDEVRDSGLSCLSGWSVPAIHEHRYLVVDGRPTADAYNYAALQAMEDGADFLLCVEDDHVVPQGTFEKLYKTWLDTGEKSIVGAWYPQRNEPRTGAAIHIVNGRREYLQDVGGVIEVHAITQGFTLIPVSVFRDCHQPWFATTGNLTQDAFFSQLARDAGYRLYIDTDAKIKHVCRHTGKTYE